MRPLLIAVVLLLPGCTSLPRVYTYSWGQIVEMDANSLAGVCTSESGRWDDGRFRPKHADVSGCADSGKKIIYVEDSCQGARAIPHELAHLDGVADPEKHGFKR